MRSLPLKIILVALLALALLSLPACQSLPAADPAAIETAVVATFSFRFTQTARAELTGTPTAVPALAPTLPPTETATPTLTPWAFTPTITPTVTPGADFAGAYLLLTGTTSTGKSLLVIAVPNLASDRHEYVGQAAGMDYPCYREALYPDRLYCVGPRIPPLTERMFVLYADDGGLPLFEIRIYIYFTPTPSLQDYQASNLCEVEPLYQPDRPELPQFQDPAKAGCYAITCWYRTGAYKCGTRDSCVAMPSSPCP